MSNTGTLSGDVELNGTIANAGVVRGDVTFISASNTFSGLNGTLDGNLTGGTGSDTFDLSHQIVTGTISGGGGEDKISFGSASGGFAVDLVQGTASGAGEAFDFSGIEDVLGTHYADTILGDANVNVIASGSGNDTVSGGAGNDTIDGGAGNDALDGGSGTSDTVTYGSAASGVTVSLAITAAQNTGGSGTDTLTGFENLTGSAYNDALTGDGNANFLSGAAGNDVISGGAGNDFIMGGAGGDVLTGGAGADTFVYAAASDSLTSSSDLITDFTTGSDKIDLSALHLVSTSEITISTSGGYSYVAIDSDNNGSADMLIKLTGANAVKMSDIVTGIAPAAVAHTVAVETAVPAHHDLVGTLHAVAVDHGLYG